MMARLLAAVWVTGMGLISAVTAQQPAPLKVVTYNIRFANPGDGPDVWPNRVNAVSQFLSESDIAGLQEVTYEQLQELEKRLDAFDGYGVGRDDGQHGGEHAVIFYRRDRLEPLERGTFWLSESPSEVGVAGWDAALPRTCTWMILRDRVTGDSMLVANTHFDHVGAIARRESGKLVLHRLREKAGQLPVILLGDFNCEPDSDPYRELTADGYLVDARSVSENPPTGPTSTWNGFREIQPGRVIDHLFLRGDWQVRSLATLDPKTSEGRFASDHLPVRILIESAAGSSGSEIDAK
jgi:endonuclease/exonuclease/phosphatase family metal-dependent hydrolase